MGNSVHVNNVNVILNYSSKSWNLTIYLLLYWVLETIKRIILRDWESVPIPDIKKI